MGRRRKGLQKVIIDQSSECINNACEIESVIDAHSLSIPIEKAEEAAAVMFLTAKNDCLTISTEEILECDPTKDLKEHLAYLGMTEEDFAKDERLKGMLNGVVNSLKKFDRIIEKVKKIQPRNSLPKSEKREKIRQRRADLLSPMNSLQFKTCLSAKDKLKLELINLRTGLEVVSFKSESFIDLWLLQKVTQDLSEKNANTEEKSESFLTLPKVRLNEISAANEMLRCLTTTFIDGLIAVRNLSLYLDYKMQTEAIYVRFRRVVQELEEFASEHEEHTASLCDQVEKLGYDIVDIIESYCERKDSWDIIMQCIIKIHIILLKLV